MYFIPLNQMESVELVINALRIAGGEADCSTCPAYNACGKQCLAVADAIDKMLQTSALPSLDPVAPPPGATAPPPKEQGGKEKKEKTGVKGGRGALKIIK